MSDDPNKKEPEELRHLSRKEVAREFRKQAYKKAKERRKTDPKFLAQKARAKDMRKAAYQAAKERNQIYAEKLKEKNKAEKQHAIDEKIKARDEELFEALEKLVEDKPKLQSHLRLVKSGHKQL
jgi:hypothetical protein